VAAHFLVQGVLNQPCSGLQLRDFLGVSRQCFDLPLRLGKLVGSAWIAICAVPTGLDHFHDRLHSDEQLPLIRKGATDMERGHDRGLNRNSSETENLS
jgi:hypothetical protein